MENASSKNQLPAKCQECAKASRPFIHRQCRICEDLCFPEDVLCDLNRSTQDPSTFECHAFRPLLKPVEPSGQKSQSDNETRPEETAIEKILNSDKVKYWRALSLQKLQRDPDEILLEIKYHFAWNVIGRAPVFAEPALMIAFTSNLFSRCSEAVGGFTNLLWLAPDHIHIAVESDGQLSPDEIAQKLNQLSEPQLLDQFPELTALLSSEKRLWDGAYFVQTIG